ncbi:MAG TPA: ATP-dependent helicase [Candidatus Wujingus californicus]|uniref:ATP-dependent helicase n=1 Tax=Candidatus Wujingus californicus TaxID=3367618 RepID=UPI004025160A
MNLTKIQRDAVKYDGNTLIVACPGSGKTRTLIAKLLHCLEEVRDTSRRIACLTYTNAAVYEIENRLRSYGKCGDEEYCDINTIHSFCLVNILNKFYWRIPEYSNGFSVITPECDEYQEIASNVLKEHGLPLQMREYFESFNREPDGTPIVPPDIPTEVAIDFWERLADRGFIDFPNIIYYAFRLISDKHSIAYALSCKYSWFLVDEFQDTTSLQVEILKIIATCGQTKFFLVGDPHQSIFGFAGARVELMDTFAKEISASVDFKLLSNFRSSNAIISHAEKLCPRLPIMHGIGNTANVNIPPIYIHAATAFEAIKEYFLPAIEDLGIPYGEAAILAPWWIKLLNIGRSLRKYGIPIVGPGARPYKKNHIFAMLAEQVCAYITHPSNRIFRQIGKELFLLINSITGRQPYSVFSYEGNVTIRKLINTGNVIFQEHPRAVEWLLLAVEAFGTILTEGNFLPKTFQNLLKESANDIVTDMRKNKVDLDNLSVDDLGLFASTERNLHLLTMHRAKGREFEAVAIIDLHEGRVPDYRAIKKSDLRRIEEDKRLLYVSITRARRFLMYVTDEEDSMNKPSRFISTDYLDLSVFK